MSSESTWREWMTSARGKQYAVGNTSTGISCRNTPWLNKQAEECVPVPRCFEEVSNPRHTLVRLRPDETTRSDESRRFERGKKLSEDRKWRYRYLTRLHLP